MDEQQEEEEEEEGEKDAGRSERVVVCTCTSD